MRTVFALLAVATTAMAMEYSAEVPDDADIWDIGYVNAANVQLSANLVARVAALESAARPFKASVELASSSIARLDGTLLPSAFSARTVASFALLSFLPVLVKLTNRACPLLPPPSPLLVRARTFTLHLRYCSHCRRSCRFEDHNGH
jgi:hypothetical protein